jgi:hypothetical protein
MTHGIPNPDTLYLRAVWLRLHALIERGNADDFLRQAKDLDACATEIKRDYARMRAGESPKNLWRRA